MICEPLSQNLPNAKNKQYTHIHRLVQGNNQVVHVTTHLEGELSELDAKVAGFKMAEAFGGLA